LSDNKLKKEEEEVGKMKKRKEHVGFVWLLSFENILCSV
jgi:hypothetical protein